MIQRKGIFLWHITGTWKRRAKKIRIAAVSMAGVHIDPPALGDPPPYSAEGAKGDEAELLPPSQTFQGANISREQAPTGEGLHIARGKGTGKMSAPSERKGG